MTDFERYRLTEDTDVPLVNEVADDPVDTDRAYDGVVAEDDTNGTPDIEDRAPDSPRVPVETPAERVSDVCKIVYAKDGPQRYSSSDSVRTTFDGSTNYSHELWLPGPAADGQSERPGLLRSTAYLDDRGFTSDKGSVMDRYHYRTGSGVVNFAQAGFAPALSAIGIDTTCAVNEAYYNRNCTLNISFGSSETTVERANAVLEASGESLRFVVYPPGMYDGQAFIEEMAVGRYPISRERKTYATESPYLEQGSHDILQHAPAILAMAGTRALQIVQERAQNLLNSGADVRDVGWFMRQVDGMLNVITFSELLSGDPEAAHKMHELLDLRSEDVQPYIDEILDNIRNPKTSGRLALPQ